MLGFSFWKYSTDSFVLPIIISFWVTKCFQLKSLSLDCASRLARNFNFTEAQSWNTQENNGLADVLKCHCKNSLAPDSVLDNVTKAEYYELVKTLLSTIMSKHMPRLQAVYVYVKHN